MGQCLATIFICVGNDEHVFALGPWRHPGIVQKTRTLAKESIQKLETKRFICVMLIFETTLVILFFVLLAQITINHLQ